MSTPSLVIDTNVIISALRSRRGAAYRLLTLIGTGLFEINISVPLVVEYEDVALRLISETALAPQDINNIIDYLCAAARHWEIYYLWRPFLKDPKDDMVLEAAVTAQCDFLVTYNQADFRDVEKQFGIKIVTPKEFLQQIGALA